MAEFESISTNYINTMVGFPAGPTQLTNFELIALHREFGPYQSQNQTRYLICEEKDTPGYRRIQLKQPVLYNSPSLSLQTYNPAISEYAYFTYTNNYYILFEFEEIFRNAMDFNINQQDRFSFYLGYGNSVLFDIGLQDSNNLLGFLSSAYKDGIVLHASKTIGNTGGPHAGEDNFTIYKTRFFGMDALLYMVGLGDMAPSKITHELFILNANGEKTDSQSFNVDFELPEDEYWAGGAFRSSYRNTNVIEVNIVKPGGSTMYHRVLMNGIPVGSSFGYSDVYSESILFGATRVGIDTNIDSCYPLRIEPGNFIQPTYYTNQFI